MPHGSVSNSSAHLTLDLPMSMMLMNLIGILATVGVLHSSSVLADAAGLPCAVLVAPGSASEVLGALQDTQQAGAAILDSVRQQHWLLHGGRIPKAACNYEENFSALHVMYMTILHLIQCACMLRSCAVTWSGLMALSAVSLRVCLVGALLYNVQPLTHLADVLQLVSLLLALFELSLSAVWFPASSSVRHHLQDSRIRRHNKGCLLNSCQGAGDAAAATCR
jgi:hypothetical protein